MDNQKMEGTLWKWTNYFSGWQPRWFVLENGILSYYRSEDDVNNGCKGSIKMSVCDVIVHPSDSNRLDLIIPGEAHFYVKAATPQERQQWLVAIGSCKACLENGEPSQPQEEIQEEQLKAKKSELRLYCDVLMQQVYAVKSAIQEDGNDVEKLSEATSLLPATCDTFIKTLEDCMKITNANVHEGISHQHSKDGTIPSSPTRRSSTSKTGPWSSGQTQRSISVDRYIPSVMKGRMRTTSGSGSRSLSDSAEQSSSDNKPETRHSNDVGRSMSLDAGTSAAGEKVKLSQTRCLTFFTTMPNSLMDIKLQEDAGIPTVPFLEACSSILPIFDKLNPTAFAPGKLDISGNIRKIQQKYSSKPEQMGTLQQIVMLEIQAKQSQHSNSATVALLWLKRGLEYIQEFLNQYLSGIKDLNIAANSAYTKTLKPYHSFVVREVFALAVEAVPTHEEFLLHLTVNRTDVEKPDYERVLLEDMEGYVTALQVVLQILNDFYRANSLDSSEQI